MDRDPGRKIGRGESLETAAIKDDEFERWMSALPPPPGLPSTLEEIAAADARAMTDVAAGRCHPHALVGEWLETIGSPDYKPFREWLAGRNA